VGSRHARRRPRPHPDAHPAAGDGMTAWLLTLAAFLVVLAVAAAVADWWEAR
jgi:hypothetical protein